VLDVLDPAQHAAETAACLAEISFITTPEEDAWLHDPAYLEALGEAVASGVHDFVNRQAARAAAGRLGLRPFLSPLRLS
jgi:hypothetical protein